MSERTDCTITSLKNPVWSNAEKTAIDCEITLSVLGDEVLPFTATSFDPEPHGRKIFEDLVAGVYGLIADYVEKVNPTLAQGQVTNIPNQIL